MLRVQLFPQGPIGLRHGTSYIEASASRSGTFPTLFFVAGDFEYGMFSFLVWRFPYTGKCGFPSRNNDSSVRVRFGLVAA